MLAGDMGVLIRRATGDRHSLLSRHVVGRSPTSHLTLDNRLASGIHAQLLWNGSAWEVHDLGSRNGTFVDGRKLETGTRAIVRREAQIAFGDAEDPFELVQDGPPCAVAVSDDGQRQESESGILILPDPERPMCTIFEGAGGNWLAESNDGSRHRIASGDTLRVAGRTWRIELPAMPENTWQPEAGQMVLRDSTMRISVSGDQERVDIRLLLGDQVIPLRSRSYCQLVLALARAWVADEAAAGAGKANAGWRPVTEMLEMLHLSETTFNTHIVRARKDLAQAGVLDATDLVERQPMPPRVRLGVRKVEIVQT
jgi:pSer/pThr/pTyr-binding forkhead associated (FHA) protein